MVHLRLTDVSRDFDGPPPVRALSEVSLELPSGTFVAIEGPSGGGKSTLLNTIGLLDEPTGGDYEIDSVDTRNVGRKTLARLRSDTFSFVFQGFHLLDRRPVIDSVELGLLYRSVPKAERRRLSRDALAVVGLQHHLWSTAANLSGGQRQRVAIARALASGAPVVVADEPTGNLDSENSAKVVESLRVLHRAGATVVLVTHDADVAAAADSRLRIKDGRLTEVSVKDAPVTVGEIRKPPGSPSRVRFTDLVQDAASNLTSKKARTGGLVAAVALGVALAVATLGISVSATSQVAATFDEHTNRDVSVEWAEGAFAWSSTESEQSVVTRLENVAGVAHAGLLTDLGQHGLKGSRARSTYQVPVYGQTGQALTAGRAEIDWAPGNPGVLGAGEVLLGSNLASQVELGPLLAGPVFLVDETPLTVVGVVRESPREPRLLGAVVADQPSQVVGTPSQVKALLLTSSGAAQQVARQAPLVINPIAPESLTVSAPVDPSGLRGEVESDLQTTLLAFTGIALLASIAGLANAMIMSVIERKQEFGLRRAIGARPVHITGLVLAEAVMIGGLGGVLGLFAGFSGVLGMTISRHWVPVFDLRLAPLAILGGVAVGAIGGLFAAGRASRIQPHQALRL